MNYDPHVEIFRKPSELIGLVPLMLRWPLLCFRKISGLVAEISNDAEFKRGAPLEFYLTPYLAHREIRLPGESEITLACFQARSTGLDVYAEHLKNIPQLYFLLDEVTAAEKLFPDLREIPEARDIEHPLFICTPANISDLAQITLFYMLNNIEATHHAQYRRVSEAWDLTLPANHEILTPPSGLVQLPPEKLWPRWSMDTIQAPTIKKPDLADIRAFIVVRVQQGQTDPVALAREVDVQYPGLTDGQLGALLPTELFPAQGRPDFKNFNAGHYDALSKVSAAANRKRGQRLRGKAK